MSAQYYHEHLHHLLRDVPAVPIGAEDRYVIFSDMHIGNGKDQDDFSRNGDLLLTALEQYYLPRAYGLILNGDIEELYKFSLSQIYKAWNSLFDLFAQFRDRTALFKIIGNHDADLIQIKSAFHHDHLLKGLKLTCGKETICIFHGHQLSKAFLKYNHLMGCLLRSVVLPLKIKNPTAAYNSTKRFMIEKRVYGYSTKHRVVSIIGHTHRPLFESLSRYDELKYRIERLCRDYPDAEPNARRQMEIQIEYLKKTLKKYRSGRRGSFQGSLYNADVIVPCVFNSGCVIGKRGITAIELFRGRIRLVHWLDRRRYEKSHNHGEYAPEWLGDSGYARMVLKEDQLRYIFTRIHLLA